MNNKITLIYGPQGSGKTTKAREIAKGHETQFINASDMGPNVQLKETTEILVIDEVWFPETIDVIFNHPFRESLHVVVCLQYTGIFINFPKRKGPVQVFSTAIAKNKGSFIVTELLDKLLTKRIKANELKVGDVFKLEGKRKYNTVRKIVDIDGYEKAFPPIGPKVLIIVDNCRQWTLLKEREVIVLCNE